MSIHQLMFANHEHPMIVCDAADFDGTNDYMLRGADLTGSSDGKSGTMSVWIRIDGGDGTLRQVFENGTVNPSDIALQLSTGNIILIQGRNAAQTIILTLPTSNAYLAGATWLHILASWDLTAGVGHMYVNDVSDVGSTTLTNDTIDYTEAQYTIGGSQDGGLLFNGCIAELWFAQNTYLDLSNVYNRRKFISASGKPVHLGTTGALPTGTAPIVYHHLDDGEAVANFATNRGTGGGFPITGALVAADSSPS